MGGKALYLRLPLTAAFIKALDADENGRVTRDELEGVWMDAAGPYAKPNGDVSFEVLNGRGDGTYGTLQIKMGFNITSGHEADWNKDIVVSEIDVQGINGGEYYQRFATDKGNIDDVKDYNTGSGGGCDAGLMGVLALLLAAPVFFKKSR